MKKFVIGSLALVAFAAPAFAADMPAKAPYYKAPAAAPYYNWAGFYVGLNGGYAWGASHDQLALAGDAPTGLFSKGGFGGGQIGYNFQMNQFVYGIEADFQGADIKDSVHDLVFGDSFSSKLDWFGTVRGRLGWAWNNWLLYGTGGFAYGKITNSVASGTPPITGAPFNISRVATGYTVGGGVEYGFAPAWSIKAEYQYVNLGKNDPTGVNGAPYSLVGGGGFATVRDDAYHTVRLGLNYKFMP